MAFAIFLFYYLKQSAFSNNLSFFGRKRLRVIFDKAKILNLYNNLYTDKQYDLYTW